MIARIDSPSPTRGRWLGGLSRLKRTWPNLRPSTSSGPNKAAALSVSRAQYLGIGSGNRPKDPPEVSCLNVQAMKGLGIDSFPRAMGGRLPVPSREP